MDKVFLERPSVNEVLRDKIRKYKKEHSRLSSNQIARRLGLPPSTFHRLEMGDVKNPGLDICVTVLNGLCSKKDTAEFVREYFPEVHESLFSHFSDEISNSNNALDVDKFFRDESTYKLMMKASSYAGQCESELLQEYGRAGHRIFMKLAADGVITNKNGRFYSANDVNVLGQETSMDLISLVTQEMANETKVHGTPQNSRFNFCFESVDSDKVKSQLKELADEYAYNVKKILFNPENRGDDVYIVSNFIKKI